MMEDISISFSQDQDEEQTITIVNVSNINENIEVEESPSALIHQFLDENLSNGNKESIILKAQLPHCLVCNAKLCVSKRGAVNIFSKEFKSSSRQLDIDFLLGSILSCELDSANSHSDIVCKKCYKLVEDYDELENQLHSIKKELSDKYIETKCIVYDDSITYIDDEDDILIENNDPQPKSYTSKGRLKKKKKGTEKVSVHYPDIKLEVKEEPEDKPSIKIESYDGLEVLMKSVCDLENSSSEEDLYDTATELDGLDIDYENGAFQFEPMDTEDDNTGIKNSLLLQMETYKCRFCKMKSSFSSVQRHLIEVHADRLYECEVCSNQSNTRLQLMEHLNQHLASGEKPFPCPLCNEVFALPRQLKLHLKKHNRNFSCYQCARSFRTATALREHSNTHNGNLRPFQCEHCNKNFASRNILKSHMKTHGARTRSHKCDKCGKLFYTFHHLQEHSRIHQTRKKHVCEICGKAFSTPRSLDSHALTHTGIKNYACRICQKAFLRKGEVEDHERIHTGEKPFQCEYCGAVFSQRSNLLSHKKATHLHQKNYCCTDCNKAFKRRRLLKYHIQSVHTGERPYRCTKCKASFVYPEHHKKHMRIHTGEKPFKCEICNKAFNSKDNKNAHKFIHSDKKQYECMICGTGYMRKPQLVVHIQQHGPVSDAHDFIKVNRASLVDEELRETRNISMVDEVVEPNLASLRIVRDADAVFSRPLRIVEADIPKLILPKSGDEEVGHFLATLDGQMVEMRAEDLAKYTQLTADQIAHLSQVAQDNIEEVDQLTSTPTDNGAFEIQLDEQGLVTVMPFTKADNSN